MPKTVAEILKESGLSDDQIAALDAKALTAFNGVLTTAEQERAAAAESAKQAEAERVAAKAAQEAAELAQRANKDFYDGTIVPSLNGWEEKEKQYAQDISNAKALAAFYEAQNKAAKENGFIAADAPAFTPAAPVVPARDGGGKFVAGGGGTPGSPTFKMEDVDNRLGNGLDNGFWAVQEYQRLSGGQFLPDSISKLAEEATANKLPFKDYVARKYDFGGKQSALQAKADADMRAKIATEATAPYEQKIKDLEKEWQGKLEAKAKEVSERGGNNPDVRRAAISNYPEVKKAMESGSRPDPLSFKNQEERRVATRQQIHADVTANEEAKQGVAA
jgi:hypothetical protein